MKTNNKDSVTLKQKKEWWQYLYPIYKWTIFEQILFFINLLATIGIFIYECCNPEQVIENHLAKSYALICISFIANIANIVSIILGSKKKISTFVWGVVASSTIGIASVLREATGAWILYLVVQVPLQFVGLWQSKKTSPDKVNIKVSSFKWWEFLLIVIATIAGIGLFSYVDSINAFHEFWYHTQVEDKWYMCVADAGVLVVGVVATILMVLRYKEQWILWIVLDAFSIILWASKGNYELVVMSLAALVIAIYGTIMWYKQKKKI